jgi:hypothetical protein
LGYITSVFLFVEIDSNEIFQEGLFGQFRMNLADGLPDKIVFLDNPFLDLREDDYQVFSLVPKAHSQHLLKQCLQLEADKLKTREVFGLALQPVHQEAGYRLKKFGAIFFLRNFFSKNGEYEDGPLPQLRIGTAGAHADLFKNLEDILLRAFLIDSMQIFYEFFDKLIILQDREAVVFQVDDTPLKTEQHPFAFRVVQELVGLGDYFKLFLLVDIHTIITLSGGKLSQLFMANLEGELLLPDVFNNYLHSFVYHVYDLLGKEFSRFFDMKSAVFTFVPANRIKQPGSGVWQDAIVRSQGN